MLNGNFIIRSKDGRLFSVERRLVNIEWIMGRERKRSRKAIRFINKYGRDYGVKWYNLDKLNSRWIDVGVIMDNLFEY
jgi:hypothetical protein